MSDQDSPFEFNEGGRRRAKKRRNPAGCIAVLVAIGVIGGGGYFAVDKGIEWVGNQFGDPEDYTGQGGEALNFEVNPGDTATLIGRNLKEQGVIASVDAFVAAAGAEPRSSGIQPGFYPLRKRMASEAVVAVLVDPANQVKTTVTVPEGLRVADIVETLAAKTDFGAAAWEKALTKNIGLPEYAGGNPEGYLFPATYDIGPDDKPVDVLTKMVDRWRQAADEAGLEARAAELGRTPAELMTIASLVEAEGRGDDMAKISRVIWNRLDGEGSRGGTYGMLQIDAAVNYALDRKGIIALSTDEIDSVAESPYNLYKHAGLPPTPINNPGDAAIAAAAAPVDGGWYYYVTVDLATGETKFAEDYDEFLVYKAEYQEYCTTSDAC